ncbi:MAG TPA: ABC transporter ATP-binding protein, partial [Candidatus Lokiarchaeia archaeon]|nr:ABC transporter ATP-binding protein [Candidatus Lokiarchaeia archaeon]
MKFPILSKFLPYYKPHRRLLLFDMCCAAVVAVIDLIYPFYSRVFINDYIPNGNWQMIVTLSLVFLGLYAVRMACNYYMSYKGHVLGTRMETDMRTDLFKHIQTLPFVYFDEVRTGQIMSRLVGDLTEVGELAHHCAEDLFISMILMVGSLVILVFINPLLTLILFLIIIILVVFVLKQRMATTAAFQKIRVKHAEINARIESVISGIRLSKSFTNEKYDYDRFEGNNQAYLAAWQGG